MMKYCPSSNGERRVNSRAAVCAAHKTARTAPARLKGDRLQEGRACEGGGEDGSY